MTSLTGADPPSGGSASLTPDPPTRDAVSERIKGLASDRLDLILMLTEKCNFRCTYCYEDFALGRMKDGTVQGILRLLSARMPNLRVLQLGWFGGEPTLALDIIEKVNGHALAHAPEGLRFASSMSTNGWLLSRQNFQRLLRAGMTLFQISLDGSAEEHDRTRITRRREGTFDTIMENIAGALRLDQDFRIALRLHLRESNLDSADELIGMLLTRFNRDPRLTMYIKPLERLGGAKDRDIDVLTSLERAAAMKARLRQNGVLETDAEPLVCYAAMANSLIVRSDGRIGKCTVALNDSRNTIGRLDSDGSLIVDDDKFRPWIRGLVSGEPLALSCPLHGL